MKYLAIALLSICLVQVSAASDACEVISKTTSPHNTQMHLLESMMDSLQIIKHSSVDSLSDYEKRIYFLSFLKDVCKIKPSHLALTQKRGVRFYITNGPIIVHPRMAKRHKKNKRPRNHKSSRWLDLPGAYDPGSKNVIINILSLDKGHGAENLVLHEYAHALDYVIKASKKRSSTKSFKRIVKATPWLEVYRVAEYNDPDKYANEEWKRGTIQYNESIDRSSQVLIDYAKANREEHFAELYAKSFNTKESKSKLQRHLPSAVEYINELLTKRKKKR